LRKTEQLKNINRMTKPQIILSGMY